MEPSMNKNIVLALAQMTVDYTFRLPEHIEAICDVFVKKGFFPDNIAKILQDAAQSGLRRDHNNFLEEEDSLKGLGGALEYLQANFEGTERVQIGGNPAIVALRGYRLGARDRDPSLPIFIYTGILPTSYFEFADKQKKENPLFYKILNQVFAPEFCVVIKEKPMTLAIEGQYKIMLAYVKGRTLDYLGPDNNFSRYLDQLANTVSNMADRKALFVFPSTPRRMDHIRSSASLIDQIASKFGNALFFFGCSSFREGNTLLEKETKELWNSLLKQRAHIISMNETELSDLHTVVVGKGTHQDKPLAYKLLELPTEAIKVCHSASGALMDPGPDPGKALNAAAFMEQPSAFLEESLRLATDGAAFGIASKFGHDATEASVRIYSATVPNTNRNSDGFRAVFLNVLERMPAGLIAVSTPIVARPMSALTGVGARFDALLAAFLMRS
jgi:hypothetical protein